VAAAAAAAFFVCDRVKTMLIVWGSYILCRVCN
jgi:hypothetical protein